MPAFYRATIGRFLSASESELVGHLSTAYARDGFEHQRSSQTLTWSKDVLRLQTIFADLIGTHTAMVQWSILLEFPIPRKEKRIDVVILTSDTILILELKSSSPGTESLQQTEEYALLLHYFHQPSDRRRIQALVVSHTASNDPIPRQQFLPIIEAPAYWISPVRRVQWEQLPLELRDLASRASSSLIDAEAWDKGEYRPVPTIIEAALSLQAGLGIREIAHSRAARHDVDRLTAFVNQVITDSRERSEFSICFITGVPGSGKTLVGLNLAFGTKPGQEPIHFMSGTGPLVQVLQAVLAREQMERTGLRALEAKLHAKTLIENVHVFAKNYAEISPNSAPSNHVIIFDEAQRAWDQAQNFNKFRRDYSEPQMLIEIMERHPDWAVVIALVGGGQEINSGEAGLGEWGRALSSAAKKWSIYASPEALHGGSAVAGSRLLSEEAGNSLALQEESRLHLDVSVRSLKTDSYAAWVNHVIEGDVSAAASLKAQEHFPILLTRSLQDLRALLRQNTIGASRCGIVASSRAARIRAEGLEPDSSFHAEYPWHHWYLAPQTDVRSSYQLEVFATEFEIQGLELDWIGLCWGGDFIRDQNQWLVRKLFYGKQTRWSPVQNERQQTYRRNAYRVLLTRARQGIVIYIPKGEASDPTRSPKEFNDTADFLVACGARLVPSQINKG